ncbi:MAG: four helix bundle suffix domain-containing protein, partial [Muribaculaceae bacterium]|nr:four helix bundle suffix domain-containing protein [Muribaculaceae bacterium]
LEDYGDYVRQNDLIIWPADDERTLKTRKYCVKYDDASSFVTKCRERNNETVANIMMTQIRQLDAMLTNVMRQIENEFISGGGIREAMTKARKQNRGF